MFDKVVSTLEFDRTWRRRRRVEPDAPPNTVVTYLTVSTSGQAASGRKVEYSARLWPAMPSGMGGRSWECCDEGISAKSRG